MRVRAATQFDTERIVEMSAAFYATTHYPRAIAMDETSVAAMVQLLRDTGILLVAERDGEVVGMVGLVIAPFPFNFAHRIATEVVWYVDPAARGSLIALALLQAAESAARAAGCTTMQMLLMHDSPPVAARLYERAGFFHSETSYTKEL